MQFPTFSPFPRLIARSVSLYDLHFLIFLVCALIATLLLGVSAISLWQWLEVKRGKALPFSFKRRAEGTQTLLLFFLLLTALTPAHWIVTHMKPDAATDTDIHIQILKQDQGWNYDYLDNDPHFFAELSSAFDVIQGKTFTTHWNLLEKDQPILVPIGEKVHFQLGSRPLASSAGFTLPLDEERFSGFLHEETTRIQKPGIYQAQDFLWEKLFHPHFSIVIQAKTEMDYHEWIRMHAHYKVEEAPSALSDLTLPALMQKGAAVYANHCASCHGNNGEGYPPTFPALVGNPIVTGNWSAHLLKLLKGSPGTMMQGFGTQLNDEELAAVATYESNAWGNNTIIKPGDPKEHCIQPADVNRLHWKNNEAYNVEIVDYH